MLNISGIKLLIFDLDGTLVDSKLDISLAINRMLASYGYAPLEPERIWGYLGDGAGYLVDRCFSFYGIETPKGATDSFVLDYKKNFMINTCAYKGIPELIARLVSFKKAVLSNKLEEITTGICASLGISDKFDMIIGRSDRMRKKPDPEGIFAIMNALGFKPHETAIIGDTKVDLFAGMNAGIKRIAVTWGVHSKDVLAGEKPDALAETVFDLGKILGI